LSAGEEIQIEREHITPARPLADACSRQVAGHSGVPSGLVTFDRSHSLQISVDITIRPTITEVIDESFLARLEAWAEQSSGASGMAMTSRTVPPATRLKIF